MTKQELLQELENAQDYPLCRQKGEYGNGARHGLHLAQLIAEKLDEPSDFNFCPNCGRKIRGEK